MKKFTKWSLILCLALFLVGGAFSGVALARGLSLAGYADLFTSRGWWRALRGTQYVSAAGDAVGADGDAYVSHPAGDADVYGGTYAFDPAGVRDLDVDLGAGTLTLEISDEVETVEVRSLSDGDAPDCWLEEGTLHIESARHSGISFSFLNPGTDVCVRIPAQLALREVSLDLDAGTAEITGALTAREAISLSVGAGELTAEAVSAPECDIEVDMGELTLGRCDVQTLDLSVGAGSAAISAGAITRGGKLECDMGEISLTLDGAAADYDYEIDCSMGEVHMDGFSSEGLGVQRSIQNGAGRLLELDCGMGSITVSHLEKEN